MFDLFELLRKKEELQVALTNYSGNFDDYNFDFSCCCDGTCDGGCKGDCHGECYDSSTGHSW